MTLYETRRPTDAVACAPGSITEEPHVFAYFRALPSPGSPQCGLEVPATEQKQCWLSGDRPADPAPTDAGPCDDELQGDEKRERQQREQPLKNMTSMDVISSSLSVTYVAKKVAKKAATRPSTATADAMSLRGGVTATIGRQRNVVITVQ